MAGMLTLPGAAVSEATTEPSSSGSRPGARGARP